jgi:predicted N-formylglutamate amidohydrolase
MMHAAHRHGRRHGIGYLEIEVRQDLIATRALAQALAARIAPALRAYATDPPTS